MKSVLVALSLAALAAAAPAADIPAGAAVDARLDRLIRQSLPVCDGLKYTTSPLDHKLPGSMTGRFVKVEAKRHACEGQFVTFTTASGSFFLGYPWFLDGQTGTIEEKLKAFTWERMQKTVTPVVERKHTREGLFKVTLLQATENGKLPLEGQIDPDGTVFFFGPFRRIDEDLPAARLKAFDPILGRSPATGAAKPQVTVVEFSDFECPSCQHAAGYMKPILEKHGDKVRYIRYDLPLVGTHPWALAAAIAGRAIHAQKPDLFWKYKEEVYANQDKLNAFTIDDFNRGFAQQHELDMKKYDADVASDAIREELLRGVGFAFSNEVRATPTYMVNGLFVDPGNDGKALVAYVDSLIK